MAREPPPDLSRERQALAEVRRRLGDLLATVERMIVEDPGARVPLSERQDEVDALGFAINTLADQLTYTRVSRDYVDGLLNTMADLLLVVNHEGLIAHANDSARSVLGCEPERLIGEPLADLVTRCPAGGPEHEPAPPDPGAALDVTEALRRLDEPGAVWRAEVCLRAPRGQPVPVSVIARSLAKRAGAEREVVLVGRDLRPTLAMRAEQRSLEKQFHQAQKMEALGRLAGGIAHDFNNLMNVVTGYAEFLQHDLPADSPSQEDVSEIVKAARHASELTRQLLAVSRRQPVSPQVVDLNGCLREFDGLQRRLLGTDVELITELGPDLGRVEIDPAKLDQILLNLSVNAREAMPDGGTLTVETRNRQLGPDRPTRWAALVPGAYVELAVSDTGAGMPDEVREHIFEPFFTTKDEGSGLGLATCYGIVKQAGGEIAVHSAPGRGTRFEILLPRVDQADGAEPSV